jgi:hypothetical protein
MFFIDDDHKKAYQALAPKHGKEGDYLAAYYILTSNDAFRHIALPHIGTRGDFDWTAIRKKFKYLGSTHRRMAMLAYHLFGRNGKVDLALIISGCDPSNIRVIQESLGVWSFKTKE